MTECAAAVPAKRLKRGSERCASCRQPLATVALLPEVADEGAQDELAALIATGVPFTTDDPGDDLPESALDQFAMYDAKRHLCGLDDGVIERDGQLYACGVVKPLFADESSPCEKEVRAKLGPVLGWWLNGFDRGERVLIGITTEFCNFYLQTPAAYYAERMRPIYDSAFLTKLTVEFLEQNDSATYEDLLMHIEQAEVPSECSKLTEEELRRHAEFIISQARSLDAQSSSDDTLLMKCKAMKRLLALSGHEEDEEEEEERSGSEEEGGEERPKGKRKRSAKRPERDLPEFPIEDSDRNRRTSDALRRHKESASRTKATTTDLVCEVFSEFFFDQIDKSSEAKERKTKIEDNEDKDDDDATKEANGDDEENDDDGAIQDESETLASPSKRRDKWSGEPISSEGASTYYRAVFLGSTQVAIGDCVQYRSKAAISSGDIGTVINLHEKDGTKYAHVRALVNGDKTLLGDVANKKELFLDDTCANVQLSSVRAKVDVACVDSRIVTSEDERRELIKSSDFFWRKKWVPATGKFIDPSPEDLSFASGDANAAGEEKAGCPSCKKKRLERQSGLTFVEGDGRKGKVDDGSGDSSDGSDSDHKTAKAAPHFDSAVVHGKRYRVGDFAFFKDGAWKVPARAKPPVSEADRKAEQERHDDPERYPEAYRKGSAGKFKGKFNGECPFRIGQIDRITTRGMSRSNVVLRVRKLARPEDTCLTADEVRGSALNEVFWTREFVTVGADVLESPCSVCRLEDCESLRRLWREFPDTFFVRRGYDAREKEFFDFEDAREDDGVPPVEEREFAKPKVAAPLRCLDIFSGCGGLSEGLHQAGVADTRWAIEIEGEAADAFAKNNPGATVFKEDCNVLLADIMAGKPTSRAKQRLPGRQEVDLIVGGPPCQGYSGMNRFSQGEYSKFRNSLVVSFLSYVDWYRPRFFVLENVRNFSSFKKSMVLRLVLRALLEMGYQCSFGILQAGSFGVPQSRRRTIILAAATGEVLPDHPTPLTVFPNSVNGFTVGKNSYVVPSPSSAPFRSVTVFDALSDLPAIANGDKPGVKEYGNLPRTHFQEGIREGNGSTVHDHVLKFFSPLVVARIALVPKYAGADWRDLPNIEARLSDGKVAKKLTYDYDDKRVGRSPTGALRGVCHCALSGKKKDCEKEDKQQDTIVPWCLPHTSARHNQWAGLYGRLEWDGYFSTTVTNPEPMGKQGRVLHPVQDRVVSVRECARSQGFPDRYIFHGTPLARHKQIGNAVAPPMAYAIGIQIRKSLLDKEKQPRHGKQASRHHELQHEEAPRPQCGTVVLSSTEKVVGGHRIFM